MYGAILKMINHHKRSSLPVAQWYLLLVTPSIFFFLLYMLAYSAQTTLNLTNQLGRLLSKRALQALKDEPELYKVIRDLLRLVKTRPISLQMFGSVVIDMSLLPSCVAIITSYTVIALQFNNIV